MIEWETSRRRRNKIHYKERSWKNHYRDIIVLEPWCGVTFLLNSSTKTGGGRIVNPEKKDK